MARESVSLKNMDQNRDFGVSQKTNIVTKCTVIIICRPLIVEPKPDRVWHDKAS